ncbi:hypothetical protein WISP_88632 [Willisornis vidua]|uniref:Uncharacterized protein n=1 Tax=Willisornis vidua TaxID=1566151 RepID=A0ABQ9D877_9PASS|nr:hypothetical protein WISP_88632 [Willisornis vidua]
MLDGSKTDLPLPKAKPISDTGSASGEKNPNLCNTSSSQKREDENTVILQKQPLPLPKKDAKRQEASSPFLPGHAAWRHLQSPYPDQIIIAVSEKRLQTLQHEFNFYWLSENEMFETSYIHSSSKKMVNLDLATGKNKLLAVEEKWKDPSSLAIPLMLCSVSEFLAL